MAERFEVAADFHEVIDFAVVDDGGFAVFGPNGLLATVKVDYLEPDSPERDEGCGK